MKIKYTLLGLLLCMTMIVQAQRKAPAVIVTETESARFRAQVNRDAQALELLLDEDLRYIHSNGLVETKSDFIRSVSGGKIVYSSMSSNQRIVRSMGRKVMVVSGELSVKGTHEGSPFSVELLYTSIYHKRKGRWWLTNWQSTGK